MRTKVFLKDNVMEAENHSKKQGAPENPKSRINILMCIAVALAFVFSACDKDIDEDSGVKAKEAVSSIKWNGDSDKAVKVEIPAEASKRKNASGAKITSNAHSADFPGIYFIWDSKQKDNGYLKVAAAVFDVYDGFTLTSKESNTYWDFNIQVQPGQLMTDDFCYVFYIPKVYNNKNINMVFVSRFLEKGIPVIPGDPEKETVGCLTTYTFVSGASDVSYVVDNEDIWDYDNVPGQRIKTVWNNGISGAYPDEWSAMKNIKSKAGLQAEWIWDRQDTWEYGIEGSNIINTISVFYIDGEIVEGTVPFYFACDNAGVVFVNGSVAGWTTEALKGFDVPDNEVVGFTDISATGFNGEHWKHLYTVDIKEYLRQGENRIVIVAANSDHNNDRWNKDNNPAGLIYASQFTVSQCPVVE